VGSNPAVYWMDVSNKASYFIVKGIKVAKWGTPKIIQGNVNVKDYN
jgi:hypothetical protein